MEWSPWYGYRGEVDFNDGLYAEIEYLDLKVFLYWKFKYFDWSYVGKYRIKLDGVMVIEHDRPQKASMVGSLWGGKDIIGHDPSNKIIVVKENK